jgi:hypothetical protein
MARQANYPYVVREVFPAKLRTNTGLSTELKDLFLQIQVSKRAAPIVPRGGQII